ncbi:hypothetical protein J2X31_002321 [Flavobacterium arsenatis]|uniref:DUF4252 domain-containing protein n=1 Tax=Flavobacterium arsenatis TaxID=1484332 RepID=A0ABU1TQQ2_9FLAO|nr:DUF4252 domain-containing protein [Flavobacterium arsenatis]MDR6968304.1 hypothetical protein [Flavobacterium arsenatis]
MKKFIIAAVFAFLPTLIFAQQSVFDKFEDVDAITTVVVTKKMFQMMGNVQLDKKDKEAQQFLSLTKKLNNLRVFTTSNSKHASDMKATAEKHLKSAGLEELMRVKDGGQNIRILVKSGAKETQIKELLMFIEGGNVSTGKANETILLSLTGDFDLDDLSILTEKMNLPGGSALSKGSKGKK